MRKIPSRRISQSKGPEVEPNSADSRKTRQPAWPKQCKRERTLGEGRGRCGEADGAGL